MKVDVDKLLKELRLSDDCDDCPRCVNGECKGHLSWLCKKIVACAEEEDE